eukprot:COSAG01_NODE_4205_length_5241_cov_6.320241_4_plen_41_part_00
MIDVHIRERKREGGGGETERETEMSCPRALTLVVAVLAVV